MNRHTRQQKLIQEREERKENSHNGRRKERYSQMSSFGILGRRELRKYNQMYEAIQNSSLKDECSLPPENPTRHYYDLANRLYAQLI